MLTKSFNLFCAALFATFSLRTLNSSRHVKQLSFRTKTNREFNFLIYFPAYHLIFNISLIITLHNFSSTYLVNRRKH